MNDREQQYRVAHEALIILGALALLSYICRLWPMILLTMLGLLLAACRMLFLKNRIKQSASNTVTNDPPSKPTQPDLYTLAYARIGEQITDLVKLQSPEADWVWETPNAKQVIERGEDVFILLSRAGGFRRAKVQLIALRAVGLEFSVPIAVSPVKEDLAVKQETAEDTEEVLPINYDLIAFEWVEEHILELNNRLNEAIGAEEECLLLLPEELPARESWDNLCRELVRAEVPNAEICEQGIQIKFKQEMQKGNEPNEYMDEQSVQF